MAVRRLTAFSRCSSPATARHHGTASIQSVPVLFHGRSVALFTGGKASVAASAFAFDPETGEFIQRDLSVTITLRGPQ